MPSRIPAVRRPPGRPSPSTPGPGRPRRRRAPRGPPLRRGRAPAGRGRCCPRGRRRSSRAPRGTARASPARRSELRRVRHERLVRVGTIRSTADLRLRLGRGAHRPRRPRWRRGSRPAYADGQDGAASDDLPRDRDRASGASSARGGAAASPGSRARRARPPARDHRPASACSIASPRSPFCSNQSLARRWSSGSSSGLFRGEVRLEHAAEQVVVAVPAALVVEGDDEQVGAVERVDRRDAVLPSRSPRRHSGSGEPRRGSTS